MMLDDRTIKFETHRDNVTINLANGMNISLNSLATLGLQTNHLDSNVPDLRQQAINIPTQDSITTANIKSEIIQTDRFPANTPRGHIENQFGQQQQHHNQHRHQNQSDEPYFTSEETNSSSYNTGETTTSGSTSFYNKIASTSHGQDRSTTLDLGTRHSRGSVMVPTTAHCSDQQNLHYSLSNTTKNLPTSSPSNMALNFSHDLLLQTSHQAQSSLLHHSNDSADHKHGILSGSIDIESGTHLMQTAANMNMWKNTMSLGFKHEPNFLPANDINSFPNWPHSNNLGQQPSANMSHHILDGQHLIGYPQHNQRQLQLSNQQDLVSNSLKNQVCADQATFMLNSINQVSQAPSSSHHASHQLNDNLHLRSHSHEHNATSYNLSMNDNQFYNNRSHGNNKSTVFLHDRSGPSHNNHQINHLTYHDNEPMNPQPTSSHHLAGSSSSSSNRNIGTFKCNHCSEVFSMRNLYQSHLKTHSQEKGNKAKFHCELCGHSFSQKTSLNRHMKSHTGERPFPCEVCGKAFSEKERLKIHMRTHTGEKPFSCGICGKSFSQKSTVKRHQTVHTGEKKFKCDCGKGFANRGNLIAHIKTRGSNHFE